MYKYRTEIRFIFELIIKVFVCTMHQMKSFSIKMLCLYFCEMSSPIWVDIGQCAYCSIFYCVGFEIWRFMDGNFTQPRRRFKICIHIHWWTCLPSSKYPWNVCTVITICVGSMYCTVVGVFYCCGMDREDHNVLRLISFVEWHLYYGCSCGRPPLFLGGRGLLHTIQAIGAQDCFLMCLLPLPSLPFDRCVALRLSSLIFV